MKQSLPTSLEPVYDRSAKVDLPPIIKCGDVFALLDGFYVNPEETIAFRSTAETGRIFTKKVRQTPPTSTQTS